MTATSPTLVTVPCLSGAPWDERQLSPLSAAYPVRTMRLPEALDDVEAYADYVAEQTTGLSDYVLVGDSFGAVISLTLALRQPTGLRALVLSGGFAANPLPAWKNTFGRNAHRITGPLYRNGTLRYHAASLASKYDADAEVPHTTADYRRLFLTNTPAESYNARVASVISFDVRDRLDKVDVPTLLITPEDDRLVGEHAAQVLRDGLPRAREVILDHTGHMFRFTHPGRYGQTILNFLAPLNEPSGAVGEAPQD